jgi:TetR/AcrR family transcriptional regulator, lmrAB and yxaGH operons repressor
MAPRGETRQRMVSATSRLLRRRGLHGTGLQEVLAESAAPRGSLYFHFPGGKEQLVAEAVSVEAGRADRWIRRCLDGSPTVRDAFVRMLDEYAELLRSAAFGEGCPVAAVALDLGAEPGPLHAACSRALDGWSALLAERLEAEGRTPTEASGLATTAIAAFEGALLLCRVSRDVTPLRRVADGVGALLAPPAPVTGEPSA